MKRKLIITESQYNKLQEFLFETADVNDTLDYVKANDVLLFKGAYNVKINVVNVDQNTGEILGTTDKDEKVKFFFNSYDENTKKFNFQKLDKTTNKYVNQPFDVKELDILRDGKVLPIRDANRKTPEPVAKPDEISKPVELSPNVPEDETEDEKTFDDMVDNIEAEMKSDDIFRQALYKQPNFWERLSAEIKGEKPKGSGIIIANQLVNSYRDKTSNDFLGATFNKDYKARFKSLENYDFEYYIEDKLNYISFRKGGEREAKVGNINEKNQRKLTDVDKKFDILVTKNISTEEIPNYFLCKLSTYSIKDGNSIKNNPVTIKLQFLDSTGFKVKNS